MPPAKVREKAAGTEGGLGSAHLLSEAYEKLVDVDPVIFRQYFHQRLFCFFRSAGCYPAESVGYPVDMGVHADCFDTESEIEDQVCCLSSHPGKGEQIVDG